ncbi:MAG: helix-turn-helix transcriptional regulator [bacterium]
MVIPDDMAIAPKDRLFLQCVLTVVQSHLGNKDFTVQACADEVGLSRAQLHRKVKALCRQSCGQVIRSIRLQRGAELLRTEPLTIGDIARRVGFKNASYFTRCFKQQFGCRPSDFRRSALWHRIGLTR